MRRLATALLLLFVLLGTHPLSRAQAQNQAPSDSERLRQAARNLLSTGSTEDAVKAADLFQKASQIDGGHPSHVDLIPFLTTLILAGTLIFNIYQARITEKEKREDSIRQADTDERKRLVDALEIIQKSENVSPAAALINTFTTEPYRTDARRMGKTILLRSKSFEEFRDLFNSILDPITPETYPTMLEILRSVHTAVSPLLSKTWVNGTNDLSRLTPDQVEQYNLLVAERTFLGEKLATILRQPRNPAAPPPDLSGVGFDGSNLSGADLRHAVISNSTWNYVNLDGSDLRGITDFGNCWLYSTAWWHAGSIDSKLLQFFKDNLPYAVGQSANSPQPISAEEYADNLRRLEASAT